MRNVLIAAACLGAFTLALAACTPAEQAEADAKTEAAVADVKEDARALAKSTGAILKEGAGELKEGVQDLGAMAKEGVDDVEADLRDERK